MGILLVLAAPLLLAQPAGASWSFVRTHVHTETKTTGTSVTTTLNTATTSGDILIVYCFSDNPDGTNGATTHHSISDSKGNTYTRIVEQQRSAGSAKDGVTVSLHVTKMTTALAVNDTVTCTIDISTDAKGVLPNEYSVAAGKTWSIAGSAGASGSDTAPSATLSGLANSSHAWFGNVGWEGVSADFSAGDADYSNRNGAGCTSGGAAASNACERDNDRLNFTGTSDTLSHTLSTSRDWAVVLAALDEVDEGAPPPVEPPLRRRIITGRPSNHFPASQ